MIAEYDLKVGDKTYTLKYNNKALRTLEKTMGMSFMKIGKKMQEDAGINEITEILRVGLMHKNPNITVETVDNIIDEIGYKKAGEAIMKALELSLGDKVNNKKK